MQEGKDKHTINLKYLYIRRTGMSEYESFNEALTSMGFDKETFMVFRDGDNFQRTDGPDFDYFKTSMASKPRTTGHNNGVYAAYSPKMGYLVTKDPEVIKAIETQMGFKNEGLGVVFSNGDRPKSSYYADKWAKVEEACAREERGRQWENNRKEEAKAFDGVEVDGFKFTYDYSVHKVPKDKGFTERYCGSVQMPDGEKIQISDYAFSDEKKFAKALENASSKEFEDKVFKGEISREEAMSSSLKDAKDAQQKFSEAKDKLKTAEANVAAADKENTAAGNKLFDTKNIDAKMSDMMKSLDFYAQKNPKKAAEMKAYVQDVIQSAANGKDTKLPNPNEPKGFFGKMKVKLLGRKTNEGEFRLDDNLYSLKLAIQRNPEIVKDLTNAKDFSLANMSKGLEGKKVDAEKDAHKKDVALKNAKDSLDWSKSNLARSALKVAQFNKLNDALSKVFDKKDLANEVENKKEARKGFHALLQRESAVYDAKNNTGKDGLAEKAAAMKDMSPQQRLEYRTAQMRGQSPEQAKQAVMAKAMQNKANTK